MKLALVFPGQGSQSVGMMQGFVDNRIVRDTFEEASRALGQDLWQLVAEGPAEELSATVNTQPVMLTAAYAMYRAWEEAGAPRPEMVAGHSLGEYTALVVAGALSFADAVPLVRFRAQAMQEAVPMGTGAMAAILGLDDDAVRAACAEAAQGEIVEPVNFNAPSQVVIAGHKSAVERGAAVAKARGAKRALMLPVSAPFHSSLLRPAADRLRERMQGITFSATTIRVINNVDVAIACDPAQIKDALARQACNPVRWVETVRAFAVQGVTHVVECGPGKVLSGLTRRIENSLQGFAVTDPASLQQTMEALK
ncbi:MAG: ACP S-malonyltransferase [Burkholderiales bacterium]|nr:ACP S-malonyltransferase [Burkholderiales bacterium]MDP2398763.1 ACP S-malonyltransferase [Burkholderiales bacterium]